MKPARTPAKDQPESFAFTSDNMKQIDAIIARYPKGRQKSAIMPLLDLAQRQSAAEGARAEKPYGGWITTAAMDEIARILEVSKVKVYEVATFYSMYNLRPVGQHHVQLCTTTPCWLRGSGALVKACKDKLGIDIGQTSDDGKFTLSEVECLGACVNAPMVQINDDYFEDLTPERMAEILVLLAEGKDIPVGSQIGRQCSMSSQGMDPTQNSVDVTPVKKKAPVKKASADKAAAKKAPAKKAVAKKPSKKLEAKKSIAKPKAASKKTKPKK